VHFHWSRSLRIRAAIVLGSLVLAVGAVYGIEAVLFVLTVGVLVAGHVARNRAREQLLYRREQGWDE
jgi:hypothetical protein